MMMRWILPLLLSLLFNAKAQNNLGVMYGDGRGVVQDYVTAHMRGNIARANGSDNGGKLVDLLETLMSRTQIATAQERASVCVARQYRECQVGTAR
jgi:TPR repeat protein